MESQGEEDTSQVLKEKLNRLLQEKETLTLQVKKRYDITEKSVVENHHRYTPHEIIRFYYGMDNIHQVVNSLLASALTTHRHE